MATPAANVPLAGAADPAPRAPAEARNGVRAVTLGARVAQQIEDRIVRAGWPVGRNLGSEHDLQERYGVSKSVLREAVRLVEHHGAARMRRGPGGGLFVTAPDVAPAARAVVTYLDYAGTTVDDLVDARLLLETRAVMLASERLAEEGVGLLRSLLEQESRRRTEPGLWSQDLVHTALCELSGNPALLAFTEVLTRLTDRYAHTVRRTSKAEATRNKELAGRSHEVIVEAVVAGDTARAYAELTGHLRGAAAWMKGGRTGAGGPIAWQLLEAPGAKLSEMVAARIQDTIAADGWPVGASLGSEAELLERYGIGRAVLREAVRLLEHHGVARMRRGPGGGLLVTAPDPAASIDSMALYLGYRRAGAEHLRAVREAIEFGALGPVTARHGEPGIAERLEAAVRGRASGRASGGDGAPPATFHDELVHLAGNPVLSLFVRILAELRSRQDGAPRPGPAARTPADPAASGRAAGRERAHREIVAAILAGDESLARHRMRRDLAECDDW
ncbi:FadR/GntR family transcriptional regulator [Actinomadura livida]|uniref:DNA-binding FadR family transcriptional regulator n=1 Tax=Actinomadura livida TaxID=79909 RepID=A0A7W7IG51_9ACTN|nr:MULTISPECIES: FCD domain-containing protein [Actinomadura]MBB4776103.1 DNA-binding FadR family transcriptional regulator [Actinomadura catellatispora]GGU15478.1 GntR family transcriptional regulator [Actinomadura livida]